jgi:quinoprotein glucose dehydrogenase
VKGRLIVLTVALVALPALHAAAPQGRSTPRSAEGADDANRFDGWAAYGGGPEQMRYSSLAQIDRSNVRRLDVAWTFDSGESGGLQTNPIVVGRVLYTTTPSHKVVALDAATGVRRWTFDSGIEGRGPNRGVTYWASRGGASGSAAREGGAGGERGGPSTGGEARLFTGQGTFVYALDPATGRPVPTFGRDGRVDLREGLGRDPATQSVLLTTPGVVYRDVLIVGGRVSEGLPASPGSIRAYDVRTGAVRWTFHTIPQPGEFGHTTWPTQAWTYTGGANVWAGMAVDVDRGIVFAPTGSAAADFYGANRLGDNLFANSLLALDATTGKRIWHFQAVRHDLWDRDFPAPPSLVTVTRNGRRIDAVAQTTKHGHVFLFDRRTGRSLFPIEPRHYPASTVDGERTAATQPFPTRPAPFARQVLTEDMLTTRTPEASRAVREAFRSFQGGGPFVPFGVGTQTVVFPGFDGGAEWGGSAFDPETGLLYVNANEMAWTGGLAPVEMGGGGAQIYARECATCHRDDRQGAPPQIPSLVGVTDRRPVEELAALVRQGAGRMPGFPSLSPDAVTAVVAYLRTGRSEMESTATLPTAAAPTAAVPTATGLKYRFTGYRKFLDPDGYPAVRPPWGTLNAIDLNTGDYAWTVPLGEYPELAAQGLRDTGSENYGGPVVTAGGLVFIAATAFDNTIRAFDKATGARLWEARLPFAGIGTPSTYQVDGRQFLVVPAAGGKAPPRNADGAPTSGGMYVAFALPPGAGSRR